MIIRLIKLTYEKLSLIKDAWKLITWLKKGSTLRLLIKKSAFPHNTLSIRKKKNPMSLQKPIGLYTSAPRNICVKVTRERAQLASARKESQKEAENVLILQRLKMTNRSEINTLL